MDGRRSEPGTTVFIMDGRRDEYGPNPLVSNCSRPKCILITAFIGAVIAIFVVVLVLVMREYFVNMLNIVVTMNRYLSSFYISLIFISHQNLKAVRQVTWTLRQIRPEIQKVFLTSNTYSYYH